MSTEKEGYNIGINYDEPRFKKGDLVKGSFGGFGVITECSKNGFMEFVYKYKHPYMCRSIKRIGGVIEGERHLTIIDRQAYNSLMRKYILNKIVRFPRNIYLDYSRYLFAITAIIVTFVLSEYITSGALWLACGMLISSNKPKA